MGLPCLCSRSPRWGLREAFAIGGVLAIASALAFGLPLL